ncbi:unnamed protein product [Chondrus crispus]|uniref:Uncharacterized protein n=1 Tax=Chondrus crispus TaxID=2769 RepID=R7QSB5_CHOCR|nr:unnamed protein product [Chondrus crispus]CDF40984.1 unnamed protein product [Chondrus crispus]|eukprot:XP_005711278.1 unnamed protein product [Chondrus crispus]
MRASSSALDLAPSSGPLSADPASDDALLPPADLQDSARVSGERECQPIFDTRSTSERAPSRAPSLGRPSIIDDHSVVSGDSFPDIGEGSPSRSSESVPFESVPFESVPSESVPISTTQEEIGATSAAPEDPVEAVAEPGVTVGKMSPVRSALSLLLPGDDISETSTFEDCQPSQSEQDLTYLGFNAPSFATADDHAVMDSVMPHGLDPLVLPSQDDFSVAHCTPDISPLAGVFYGADSISSELNSSPDTLPRDDAGLADYPEYEVLKNQTNEDSIFGSEPNTPVLRTTSGWNEPFGDYDEMGDRLREERVPLGHVNFEDRNRDTVPEVLLHDWSGSIPVEPNVDIVDSAPNSRSSTTYSRLFSAHTKEADEYAKTANLISSQLTANLSKLFSESSQTDVGEGAVRDRHGRNSLLDLMPRPGEVIRHESGIPPSPVRTAEHDNSSVLSQVAWVSSEYEDHSRGARAARAELGRGGIFTSIAGTHAPDPRLDDFQTTVQRRVGDGGRRAAGAKRGRSFAETERAREDADGFAEESGGATGRRRRLSNLESSGREEGGLRAVVMGRLASGMHLAKKLVS